MVIVRTPDISNKLLFEDLPWHNRLQKLALTIYLLMLIVGCSQEKPTEYTPDTPWTVELVSGSVKAVLKAPFGAFLIQRAADVNYVTLTAKGLSSVTMQYHYESRLPYYVWKNLPDPQGDDIYTYADITPTDKGNNFAFIFKKVYFDAWTNTSKKPRDLVAMEISSVWNNTAVQYENFNTTWYIIKNRSDLDGIVIVCRNSAFYCNLRGARATKRVGINSLSVPIADVENWRDYQELVQQKVRSAIVSVETIASD